ncbi:MAG: M16 family metallopeptidase [Hyphomicrobium sp.]
MLTSSPSRRPILVTVVALILSLFTVIGPAHAMRIQTVTSPGGIEAWLVEAHGVPMMALRFSFEGGNAQDPSGKEGLANFMTAMMDEGAGDMPASQFQERMEELAVRMSYDDTKDAFYGSFETLTKNRDAASDLLRLALTKTRFDKDAVDRIRQQLLANLVYAARDPEKVAAKEWYTVAFDGHTYARPANGTDASLKAITRTDLADYRKRVFAKSNLKVVAVGDIDAAELGALLDKVFGDLPATAELVPIAKTAPVSGGREKLIAMDVPQAVATFGLPAMPRKDPDFLTAFVLNQLVGGGGFASRLMEEVREKRGLAYSVYSYLQPYRHASILSGGVATKAESIGESLDVIRAEFKKMADEGPSQQELDNAKSYLVGSYALRFDTSAKIASQLLGLMEEGFGPDYVEKRNGLIEAITLADAKRVAKTLFAPENLIVTIVGQPVAKKG